MLPTNSIGELCEGKPHAQFDEEVEGTGFFGSPGSSTLLYPWAVGRRTDNQHPGRATLFGNGEAVDGDSLDVCEDGTWVLGYHSDPGRSSVLRGQDNDREDMKGNINPRGMDTVGTSESWTHMNEEVRRGHSSDDTLGNQERAKGPWATKGSTEKVCEMTFRGYEPEWQVSRPVLYGKPPKKGEDAERPLGTSSAVGEAVP